MSPIVSIVLEEIISLSSSKKKPQKESKANALITWTPTLIQNMDSHDSKNWEMANWSNGDPFANTWQPDNITFNNGIMTITLDNKGCPQSCDGKPYASGEYRTKSENYGYGYYEARMKPAQGSGLMAGSFFIYRGVYGQTSHDEIDIEFLGKDPNCQTLQLNYYVEGRGGHEKIVQLPFNACQEFHNYGFKWTKEALIWYVDGKEVHQAAENPDTPEHEIPYRPGKIMVNFWPGTSELIGWLGRFTYPGHPLQAQYDWIKYSTLEAAGQE
jgi:beta-glucanase (GH16 family)